MMQRGGVLTIESVLDPLVCRHPELLHGMNDRLACIRREEVDNLFVNRNVHLLELVAGLNARRRQLNLNDSPIPSSDTLPHDCLGNKPIDDSRQSTARKAHSPGKLTRSHLFILTDRTQELELSYCQFEFVCRSLDLDLAVFKKLIREIRQLFRQLVSVRRHGSQHSN